MRTFRCSCSNSHVVHEAAENTWLHTGPCCGDRSGGRRERNAECKKLDRAGTSALCSHSVHPGIDPHTLQLMGGISCGWVARLEGKESVPELTGLQSQSTQNSLPQGGGGWEGKGTSAGVMERP